MAERKTDPTSGDIEGALALVGRLEAWLASEVAALGHTGQMEIAVRLATLNMALARVVASSARAGDEEHVMSGLASTVRTFSLCVLQEWEDLEDMRQQGRPN